MSLFVWSLMIVFGFCLAALFLQNVRIRRNFVDFERDLETLSHSQRLLGMDVSLEALQILEQFGNEGRDTISCRFEFSVLWDEDEALDNSAFELLVPIEGESGVELRSCEIQSVRAVEGEDHTWVVLVVALFKGAESVRLGYKGRPMGSPLILPLQAC